MIKILRIASITGAVFALSSTVAFASETCVSATGEGSAPHLQSRIAETVDVLKSVSTRGPVAELVTLPPDEVASAVSNVLKTRHDTVKNSIGNIR